MALTTLMVLVGLNILLLVLYSKDDWQLEICLRGSTALSCLWPLVYGDPDLLHLLIYARGGLDIFTETSH